MPHFLGIDGGGTRTTAWLADERKRVFGRAVAGPSNPLKVGFDACQREILRAAKAAMRSAGIAHVAPAPLAGPARARAALEGGATATLDAVVLGLAGVDRPPVHRKLFAWLRKAIPARHHLLTSDAAIALCAGAGVSPGIVVISGTGSIAFARDERGQVLRSGGWGTLYDDAGSGYDVGRKAIAAALYALDGRGQATRLGAAIRRALHLRELTEVVWRPPSPQAMAALFPVVLRVARRGDFVARYLLEIAAHDLAELALALIQRLGWKRREFTVVAAGGVFRSSARVRRTFAHFIHSNARRARVTLLGRPPVEGALALARELAEAGAKSRAPGPRTH